MSLQEVQQKTTSTEFVEWCVYMDRDANEFHPEHYYMAQIAAEVRRGWVKEKHRVEVADFVLKFTTEKTEKEKAVDKEAATQSSQNFWFAVAGHKEA